MTDTLEPGAVGIGRADAIIMLLRPSPRVLTIYASDGRAILYLHLDEKPVRAELAEGATMDDAAKRFLAAIATLTGDRHD